VILDDDVDRDEGCGWFFHKLWKYTPFQPTSQDGSS
jgi:hypothetical protein